MTTTTTSEALDLCEVCGGRGGDPEATMSIKHDYGAFDMVTVRLCKTCVAQLVMTMATIYNASAEADRAEVAAMKKMFGMEDDT